jgi:hypothetical protein
MQHSEIVRYCNLMEDIKRRLKAADDIGMATGPVPLIVRTESMYLQIRKTLELIAFGSLVSNQEEFSKVHAKFSRYWNAGELFRDLERINSLFYPVPKIEIPPEQSQQRQLADKVGGYLTKDEFIALYGRCGDLLHERNPYARSQDIEWFASQYETWRDKIIGLLDVHTIHLVGMPGFFLVQMQAGDGNVHHYQFEPVK